MDFIVISESLVHL